MTARAISTGNDVALRAVRRLISRSRGTPRGARRLFPLSLPTYDRGRVSGDGKDGIYSIALAGVHDGQRSSFQLLMVTNSLPFCRFIRVIFDWHLIRDH